VSVEADKEKAKSGTVVVTATLSEKVSAKGDLKVTVK
jgi:hypothetical protein